MSFIVAEELIAMHGTKEELKLLDDIRHTYKSRASTEAYWTYNKTTLDIFKKVLRRTTPEQLDTIIAGLLTHKKEYCYAYIAPLIQKYKDASSFVVYA